MLKYIFVLLPLAAALLTWFINRRKIFHFITIAAALVQMGLIFPLKSQMDDLSIIFLLLNNMSSSVLLLFTCQVYSRLILLRAARSSGLGRRYSVVFIITALCNLMVISGIPWHLYSLLFVIVLLLYLLYYFQNELFQSVRFHVYILLSTMIASSIIYTLLRTLQNTGISLVLDYILQAMGTLLIITALYFASREKNIVKFILFSSLVSWGTVFIGIGFYNYPGLYAALLYIFITVPVYLYSYMATENISLNYITDKIGDVRGLLNDHLPLGLLIFIMIFSLASLPPLGLFFSEMKIIYNAFSAKNYFIAVVLILKNIIFTYIILKTFIPILYGSRRVAEKKRDLVFGSFFIILMLLAITIFGLFLPTGISRLLNNGISLILGNL